jgi:putative methyltransferase
MFVTNTECEVESADKLIRTLPEDFTNGFFVACFIRKSSYKESAASVVNTSNLANVNSKKRKRKRKRKSTKKIKNDI